MIQLPLAVSLLALDWHIRDGNHARIVCQGHGELCFQRRFIKTGKRPSCIGRLELSSCDGSVIRIPRLSDIYHSV